MRAALAQALFLRPGLLLLDEPTNHLDLPATLWLASYLSSPACAKTAVLLVTHSADFVASCATDLLHLDHFKRVVTHHKGDVWNFLNGAADRHKADLRAYEAQQKRLRELKTKGGLSAEKAEKKLLKRVGLFDVYEGKNLEPGHVSYAVSLVLQDEEKTLNEKRIEQSVQRILDGIVQATGAQLRD